MNVLLGVCGGIAAYKSVFLLSLLKKNGYSVDVVMTEAACNFVTPLTFETIASKPVYTQMFSSKPVWEVEHIALAKRAEAAILAPATANTIAKIASGIADNMLTTVFLALKCPILVVPAMNTAMLNNDATQHNLTTLQKRGFEIMESPEGVLACGEAGKGRMPEPADITAYFNNMISPAKPLRGFKALITAGPTREPIDPVRYLSNRSSGKMGYALAEAAQELGAEVTLISGPVALTKPKVSKIIDVLTAEDMYNAVKANEADKDFIIMAAAVADYTPKAVEEEKIKKGEYLNIELVKTKDILSELGKNKHCLLVGFAAETNDIEKYALKKLKEKNLDMIVANDVSNPLIGFDSNDNECVVYTDEGTVLLNKSTKINIAKQIMILIANRL